MDTHFYQSRFYGCPFFNLFLIRNTEYSWQYHEEADYHPLR